MTPVVCDCEVVRTERLGAYVVLTLRAPDVAATARPGQFVTIALEPGTACILRRPFSVYEAHRDAGTISVAFDAIGSGTRWLASRAPGDDVGVVGPLGRGFTVPDLPGEDLLVGGGYGTAALTFLAVELAARGARVRTIVGARTADRLFVDDVLRRVCDDVTITTDDGTAGARGMVIDPMPEAFASRPIRTVYACGPNRMLEAVGAAAATARVRSELAVEEFMACGIGVCWTCVFPIRTNGAVNHLRSCTEGPVFEGTAIAWA